MNVAKKNFLPENMDSLRSFTASHPYEGMYNGCSVEEVCLITKTHFQLKNVDMREYSLDQVNIPRMYFQEQSNDFNNQRNYLSQDFKRLSTAPTDNEAPVNPGPAPKRAIEASATHETTKRLRNA